MNRCLFSLLCSGVGWANRVFRQTRPLSELFADAERVLAMSNTHEQRLKLLLGRKLRYLDVGARGGLSPSLQRYSGFFEVFLAEPDPNEAASLRAAGYSVTEKLVAGTTGPRSFFVTRKSGVASMLRPCGRMLPFFASDARRGESNRFEVVKEETLEATTIDELANALGVSFDILKLDTQGTEFEILRASPKLNPLIIFTEISFAELYVGQGTFYDLGQHLLARGYVLADLTYMASLPRRSGLQRSFAFSYYAGLPIHGDAVFITDWTSPAGAARIRAQPKEWAALMSIFGMEELVRYIADELKLEAVRDIERALSQAPMKVSPTASLEFGTDGIPKY